MPTPRKPPLRKAISDWIAWSFSSFASLRKRAIRFGLSATRMPIAATPIIPSSRQRRIETPPNSKVSPQSAQ